MREYKLKEIEKDKLRVLGRNTGELEPLTLFWHGSGVELNVAAKELWLEFYADYEIFEQWIGIWIDGALISRHILTKGKNWVPIFLNEDPALPHHVKVIKEVQPMDRDEKNVLQILQVRTDGELRQVPDPSVRIEFIGDSITSGEGTVGASHEMVWTSMVMTTSFAYPFLTTVRLDGDCRIMSQGGWGVLCSWDGDPKNNIPSRYEQICSVLKGQQNEALGASRPYNFGEWQPDVVVINLGTNDESAFSEPANYVDERTGELFDQKICEDGSYDPVCLKRVTDAVKDFMANVRKHNPQAKIIWIYDTYPGKLPQIICDTVEEYIQETGDENAMTLKAPSVTPETSGSRNHPGRIWHNNMVDILEKVIREK